MYNSSIVLFRGICKYAKWFWCDATSQYYIILYYITAQHSTAQHTILPYLILPYLTCMLNPHTTTSTYHSTLYYIISYYFILSYLTCMLLSHITGLYMCSSGTHPGGGVMGAPGRNCAGVVLSDLGIRTL